MNGALASGSVWRSVVKLFRLRIRLFIIGFKRSKTRRKIGIILLGVIALVILVGMFILSWSLLSFLETPEFQKIFDATSLLHSLPALILTAAFAGLSLTSFGVLLQGLYLANDMDFLLSAPVPMRAVFITKMVQAILPNFGLILLFGLPVLYGMGFAAGYSILYFVLIPLVFLALALSAAGLSSLLVMGIVRIFPAKRVAEVLAFLGAILSFVCSQTGQFTNRLNLTGDDLTGASQALVGVSSPFNPLAWAGNGLVQIMEGRWLPGLGQVSLFLLVAGGIFYLALSAAERLYYTGWARIQVGGMKKKTARSAPVQAAQAAPLLTRLTGWIPNPVRGIMIKDWILMRRDLRNFSQLITPLIFGVVYGFVLLGNRGEVPPGRGEMPAQVELGLSHLLIYANIGLTLFVCWMIQSRLALMGFSAEGKSYWLLRASPIPPGRLLLAKFLVAFLPTLLLGWLFLIAISLAQNSSPQVFIYGLGVVAFSIAGAVGVNLSFGVTGARTDWEDPRHMLRSTTGCLASLASFAYLFVCLVCFFGPPLAVVFLGGTELLGYIIGMVLGGVVSLACAVIPPRLVIQRVARVGEE